MFKEHFFMHIILLLFSCLLLISCDSSSLETSDKSTSQTTLFAFGTQITLTLDDVSPTKQRALNQQIEQQFNLMNQQWHAWQPSTLTAINTLCENGKIQAFDDDIIELLQKGKTFYTLSD